MTSDSKTNVVNLESVKAIQATGSLASAWEFYRASRKWIEIAPKTRQGYATAFRWGLAHLPPQPTVDQIENFLGDVIYKYGKSEGTADFFLRAWRAVLEYTKNRTHLEDHRVAWENFKAATAVKWSADDHARERRCPPLDTLVRCEALCQNNAEKAIIRLACLAGLRIGEIKGLRFSDLSPDGVLTVNKQRGRMKRKNHRAHYPLLDAVTIKYIQWTHLNRGELVTNKTQHLCNFLFPFGKPWFAVFIDRLRAGLGDDASRYFPKGKTAYHAFRHLGATVVASQTGSVMEVSRFLGDKSCTVASMYMSQLRGSTSTSAVKVASELDKQQQRGFGGPPVLNDHCTASGWQPASGADSSNLVGPTSGNAISTQLQETK